MSVIRERDLDDIDVERYSKRTKLGDSSEHSGSNTDGELVDASGQILPPSHALLGVPLPVAQDGHINLLETDVGISEYIGRDVSKIEGIIKQRFTDFLVYEVDQDGNAIHIKTLARPASEKKEKIIVAAAEPDNSAAPEDDPMLSVNDKHENSSGELGHSTSIKEISSSETQDPAPEGEAEGTSKDPIEPWPESFTTRLSAFLSETAILKVKEMFLEGPKPPRVSDSGWAGRQLKPADEGAADSPEINPEQPEESGRGKRGRERGGRGRGGRGGRGGRAGGGNEDHRKVLSDPISSKTLRTGLHQAIRELFGGKFDTETDSSTPSTAEEGSKIVIKWAKRGGARGGRGGGDRGGGRGERGGYPPYIHFTLQKTNRDTQDALSHLSRILKVNVRDLSVAGTKDKRGITVQRVSLKRNNKTVEDVWNLANGKPGHDTQRGERGVRIADLNYRKASLELGMLSGNAFVITLRNVQVDSMETLDKAMNTIKTKGFINYYGMQRFGTASVPTHTIGLAFLKSEWQKAVDLILSKRAGEHPDVVAAREAWLLHGDLETALELMPRRVVAERCILESFQKQKGETRNAMGALSTIPRNLRLMYIHAYQSYVWNAIVSERIRTYGTDKPIAGDLVFETAADVEPLDMVVDVVDGEITVKETEQDEVQDSSLSGSRRRSRRQWVAPRVKTLTEEDLDKYSIFDVIMPLPGTDVAYPGGPLGEKYREYLRRDGLDPDNFVRKQKDYTLNGSYRAILHLPREMSWSVLRYTDPEVPLAQSDEDKLLSYDPPAIVEDGKFMALQINLTLGTAAYATMALREITKTETSSHYQTSLTNAAEDQKYRGTETTAG